MEETGNYHLPIYKYLAEKEGYEVIKENAFKINKYLDREIRKSKTDKKDAKKLGQYVIENWAKISSKEEDEEYKELRFLARQYSNKVDVQRKLKVDLSNLCDLIYPGFYEIIDEDNIEVALDLLKIFYHSDIVKEMTEEELIKK